MLPMADSYYPKKIILEVGYLRKNPIPSRLPKSEKKSNFELEREVAVVVN